QALDEARKQLACQLWVIELRVPCRGPIGRSGSHAAGLRSVEWRRGSPAGAVAEVGAHARDGTGIGWGAAFAGQWPAGRGGGVGAGDGRGVGSAALPATARPATEGRKMNCSENSFWQQTHHPLTPTFWDGK